MATECVERVAGRQVDVVWELSAGQSSLAWVAQAGEERWVVRVPVKDSGRRITYRAEAAIGRYLTSLGHPVADWTIVDHDGTMCSVAREIPGVPVACHQDWTDDFGRQLAHVLADLHEMPAEGFGPLANDHESLRGLSDDRLHGITDRWFHARIWPFDNSSLHDHPITEQAPDIAHAATTLATDIEAAGTGPIGVVHSDLHREHLLVGNDGSLNGVLDFDAASNPPESKHQPTRMPPISTHRSGKRNRPISALLPHRTRSRMCAGARGWRSGDHYASNSGTGTPIWDM